MNLRSVVMIGLLAACGTSDDSSVDTSDRDPRCVSACPETMPPYAGAGRVCDAASRNHCLDECEARIAGVSPVCQSCLVEDACLAPSGCDDDVVLNSCTPSGCTIESELGKCTYPMGDEAAKLRCYQQVDPRREVTCTPEFRPATDCATVCP